MAGLQRSPAVRLLTSLRHGDVDAAVIINYPSGTEPAAGVVFNHVLDDPLFVAVPMTHRRACNAAAALDDFASDRWRQASDARPTVLQEVTRRSGFEPILGHEVREWTAEFGFVAAGLGVTVVPGLLTPLVPKTVAVVEVVGGDALRPPTTICCRVCRWRADYSIF